MNQVFISNSLTPIIANAQTSGGAKTTWANLAHTAGAGDVHETAMCGVWSPYSQEFLDGTTAALSLIAPDNISKVGAAGDGWEDDAVNPGNDVTGTAVTAGQELVYTAPTSPQWLNRAFQLVQAMPSGNPVASPIIHSTQVRRLRWDPFNAPALHKVTCADAGLTVAVGDTLQMVLVVRWPQDIAFYESQINPSGAVTNLTPAVSAALDNPKRIYKSAEYVCASATAATEHNAFVDSIIADTANHINDLVTVTEVNNDLVVEAKFFGQIIDVFVLKNGEKFSAHAETTPPELGVGSFAEVISAEKKAQYSQGFFNRMYLPVGGVTSATATPGSAGTGYDRLVIEYDNPDGGMPGFNKHGRYGSVTLYTPNDTDYSNEANGLALEDVFGHSRGNSDAAATAVEYIW